MSSITDIFKVNQIKSERDRAQNELTSLRQSLAGTDKMAFHELKAALSDLEVQKNRGLQMMQQLGETYKQKELTLANQIQELNNEISSKKAEIMFLEDEILLQSFGFYKPRYDLQNSEMYKTKLEEIRKQQSQMVNQVFGVSSPKVASGANQLTEGTS